MNQGLVAGDLPAAFHAADRASTEAQKRFLRATQVRLFVLALAAAAGSVTWKSPGSVTDWAGVIATSAFVAALAVEGFIVQARPDREWHEARAAAESTKTLAWRYAVGGDPFGLTVARDADTDAAFVAQLREVLGQLSRLDTSRMPENGRQITEGMRTLRTRPLADRMNVYEHGRLENQQRWYAARASLHERRARAWTAAMLLFEIAGATGGIMKATGVVDFDLLGLAGTVVAGIAAWTQTKQYRPLVGAYSIAAHELGAIRSILPWQVSEVTWAEFVRDAEEAISREHRLWKASRVTVTTG